MAPHYIRQQARRAWLLTRLTEANGPGYDDLVRQVIEQFPEPEHYWSSVRAVRSIRGLLFDGFLTTESDESIWLSPEGWKAASRLTQPPITGPDDASEQAVCEAVSHDVTG